MQLPSHEHQTNKIPIDSFVINLIKDLVPDDKIKAGRLYLSAIFDFYLLIAREVWLLAVIGGL